MRRKARHSKEPYQRDGYWYYDSPLTSEELGPFSTRSRAVDELAIDRHQLHLGNEQIAEQGG